MKVYYFSDFDLVTDQVLAEITCWMPAQQQERMASLHTLSRRREQVLAYAMLCRALQDGFNGEWQLVRCGAELFPAGVGVERLPLWHIGEHGKPFLANYEGVHFNISHCSRAVAVAVSHCNVGVDVEGSRRYSEGVLHRSMSHEEQAEIAQSNNPEAAFARLWTRKEAYFKWLGTGILIARLPFVEADAQKAHCHIETQYVGQDDFFLSLAYEINS